MIHKPNYENGSIVNLMSTISKAMGHNSLYNPLNSIDAKKLSTKKNIILIVLDGLGYDYLEKIGTDLTLRKNVKDKITSVFPPTTSAAITTFLTGVAPQQHAITGWFMYLKELGVASKILPFAPKYGGEPFDRVQPKNNTYKITADEIINQKSIFEKINRKSYYITPYPIVHSENTKAATKGAERFGYKTLEEFFRYLRAIISSGEEKYIYAYWSQFDHMCHSYGIHDVPTSVLPAIHLVDLDQQIAKFYSWLKGTDSTLIITADHGMMNSINKTIDMSDHPELQDCLILPLCGEPRAAYCYVRPSKVKKFEEYINQNLDYACHLYKSEDMIKENFYGLYEPNETLFDRIGDYVLLMKDDYLIKHYVLGEEEYTLIGNHGGISQEEMYVPLIVMEG